MLRSPWQRCRNFVNKSCRYDPILTHPKQFGKVYADLGVNSRLLTKLLTILNTGGGPNFVRNDVFPSRYKRMLEPAALTSPNDANNRPQRAVEQVSLSIRLGKLQAKYGLFVCQRLAAIVILGCKFCDYNVQSILVHGKKMSGSWIRRGCLQCVNP